MVQPNGGAAARKAVRTNPRRNAMKLASRQLTARRLGLILVPAAAALVLATAAPALTTAGNTVELRVGRLRTRGRPGGSERNHLWPQSRCSPGHVCRVLPRRSEGRSAELVQRVHQRQSRGDLLLRQEPEVPPRLGAREPIRHWRRNCIQTGYSEEHGGCSPPPSRAAPSQRCASETLQSSKAATSNASLHPTPGPSARSSVISATRTRPRMSRQAPTRSSSPRTR